jgi:hypothetical protein
MRHIDIYWRDEDDPATTRPLGTGPIPHIDLGPQPHGDVDHTDSHDDDGPPFHVDIPHQDTPHTDSPHTDSHTDGGGHSDGHSDGHDDGGHSDAGAVIRRPQDDDVFPLDTLSYEVNEQIFARWEARMLQITAMHIAELRAHLERNGFLAPSKKRR